MTHASLSVSAAYREVRTALCAPLLCALHGKGLVLLNRRRVRAVLMVLLLLRGLNVAPVTFTAIIITNNARV
jgi:RNase P/RNase MRP subunit POP5